MTDNTHILYKEGMPPVAVIILNWNGEQLLRRYLPQVLASTDPHVARVIVVDNGSTDGSLRLLRSDFPQVDLLAFDSNYGFAEGYNRALNATRFPYTVLLNSDVATSPGWVSTLYEFMQAHPEAAAAQPKILSDSDRRCFEYAGASGGYIDRNGYPYCRGRIFDVCERDNGQYDDIAEVFWATGAALMVRTDLYLDAGGLDPDFFAHMEEIDLCWRLLLGGHRIYVVPRAVVYHLGGGSLPPDSPRKVFLNFRNNLLMLHKNLPPRDRRATLLRRRLLDTVAWTRWVLTGKWGNAAAVVRAHRDFARMRGRYTAAPAVNLLRSRPDARVNILVDFYLRRRHTFDKIRHS